jgi:hypothetical protein
MKSTYAPPGPPNSSEIKEMLDPIEIAAKLTQQLRGLSADYTASGFRDRFFEILQGNYQLGVLLKENPEAYRRFKDDPYWRDVRQKPNKRKVMLSVLGHTMRTKEPGRKALQDRVYKYARVLEYFYRHEVISDEIPQRLRAGGGIDGICKALGRGTKRLEKGGDTSEEIRAELPLARTGDGTTVAQGRVAAGEIDGDGCPSADNGRTLADEGQRRSVPLLTAGNDSTDALRGGVQAAGTVNRGQLPGAFREILKVEMFEFELEEVLHAKRATICVNIEPKGNLRRHPVVAQLVFTSNRTDGPWPGRSTINRDDDERR